MSFFVNGHKMHNAAVNTDPLHLLTPHSSLTNYGLKARNVNHIKIAHEQELKMWYEFGNKIGEGGFGVVRAVTDKSTSKQWAMKTVNKTTVDQRIHLVVREIQILKLINHPHIILLERVFETPKKIYMVFEMCHRDFAAIYKEQKPFSENVAKKIISEVVDAVAYLHKYDIVHRDLKMENLLVGENPDDPTDEYYIKLTDFGLSIMFKFGPGLNTMLHDFCGTIYYMSPEMITSRSYSQQCDMWAIGVILYMLVMGQYPFFSSSEKELQQQICHKDPTFRNMFLSEDLKDLILLLLMKNPVNRIRATEVLTHPWIVTKKTSKCKSSNILQMMKEWKSEMTVPSGEESDWVASIGNHVKIDKTSSRQPMILPKTNINFERNRKTFNKPNDVRGSLPSTPRTSVINRKNDDNRNQKLPFQKLS